MSVRKVQRDPENGHHTSDSQFSDEQVKEIRKLVLQVMESRSEPEDPNIGRRRQRRQRRREKVTRVVRMFTPVVRKPGHWLGWVITNGTAIALLSSAVILLIAMYIYKVPYEEIIKAPITPYQEADLKEEMVKRHLKLGKEFLNIGQPHAAKTEFEKALALNPRSAKAELGILKCDLFIGQVLKFL